MERRPDVRRANRPEVHLRRLREAFLVIRRQSEMLNEAASDARITKIADRYLVGLDVCEGGQNAFA